jgi:predicted homoserine dehydrogenase-like protein
MPIGLLQGARLVSPVNVGEPVRWDQVSLPDSLALRLFRGLLSEAGL